MSRSGGRRETRDFVNLCANNYLGLANHPDIIAAAKAAMDEFGFGMASVRFICGTQTLHRKLEQAVADYLRKDDAILFAACFDANGGLFEPLLGEEDAIVSDALNHASIIDGIRLCKAKRYRFANGDMDELDDRLKQARSDGARTILIATDGVFSMDGHVANLPAICDLAERHGAMVMIDDCHATGHLGAAGRGTPALTGVEDRVDIVSGTFGKTLGGGIGGFIAAQPAGHRPLPPEGAALSLLQQPAAADRRRSAEGDRDRRTGRRPPGAARQPMPSASARALADAGFDLIAGDTPIVPVMVDEAERAQQLASALHDRGVYVAGFFYPVVPMGKARIRTQMSAALTEADISFAADAFIDAGKQLGLI